jgi:delta8-fatty-acid desaturase
MHHYRIGYISQSWTNLTPPIRGGHFSGNVDEDDISSEDDLSDASTLTPCTTFSDENLGDFDKKGSCRHRTNGATAIASEANTVINGQDRYRRQPTKLDRLSEAFVNKVIQGEIDDNLRDYPSLDPKTQHDISVKYQALHQRVQDEGFYDCRFGEYGKEIIRYGILFMLFYVALRSEWYWLSACFLGLFWVSTKPMFIPNSILTSA